MTTPRETEEDKLLIEKLLAEYEQLCEDWRSRDRYVLDKLGATGILFGLLGVAIGTIPSTAWLTRLGLAVIGAFFSSILSISIAKDTYYRDGSEQLLKRLSARLGISHSLQTLESLDVFLPDYNGRPFSQFPRKISLQRDKSSLAIPKWLLGNWLRDKLLNRNTFKWILTFYVVSSAIFVILSILILVDAWIYWRYGLKLPV
ncbi:MAG: hypothetical protein Q8O55_04870 [Dehalococcoidales bacterium]|nr:hypothetical protein [Dehalococcoidales bacterium]